MKEAHLNLKLGSELSNLIYKSLEPELLREQTNADVTISLENENLLLTVRASELSILRAALNSYIRWINCICSIHKVIRTDDN